MPDIPIDSSAYRLVFNDASPVTDSIARGATALAQIPLVEAQGRRRQEAMAMEQAWKKQQFDRQAQLDALNAAWHDQATERQDRQDQRQLSMDDLQRAWHDEGTARQGRLDEQAGQQQRFKQGQDLFNAGLKNVTEGRKARTAGGAGTRTGWQFIKDPMTQQAYKFNRATGDLIEISDEEMQGSQSGQPAAGGASVPAAAPVLPQVDPAAVNGSAGASMSPWSFRRSDQPGINTVGDFFGGRWFGDGGQGDPNAAKLQALPGYQQSAVQFAEKLPQEHRASYVKQRTDLLNRWAEAVQAGNTDLEKRIAAILEQQDQAAKRLAGVP